MEEFIQVIVNNGLGVASFIALIYFINTTLKDMNSNLTTIKDTLILVQTNLIKLSERVSDVEEKIKEK
jgi:hypothetical protein